MCFLVSFSCARDTLLNTTRARTELNEESKEREIDGCTGERTIRVPVANGEKLAASFRLSRLFLLPVHSPRFYLLFPFSCPTFDHLRRFRYIKMSSPHLNNLIIVGCMLTYSSVIFLGLDSQLSSVTAFPYICTARAWLLMAGFSLAFGSMFSKTWRVHSIFTDVKLNKKVSRSDSISVLSAVSVVRDCSITRTRVVWSVRTFINRKFSRCFHRNSNRFE